jgi:signal transduction histidine kinase
MAYSGEIFATRARSMRWPLRYQILIPFAGVMLAVLVGASVLNAYLAARGSAQQTVRQVRDVAHTLADAKFPLTDTVLRQTHGLSGAHFVLSSPNGTAIATSLPIAVLAPRTPSTTSWDRLDLGEPIEIDAERYFHAALFLPQPGGLRDPAILHILYPERAWREARWQAAYPPLVIGAAALAVVALLALAIAARLSRPIVQLRRQVERIAHGDFEPLPLPMRNDELRDLVGSVNALAGQLDEMQRVIKRSERLALLGQLAGGLAHHLRNDVTGARIAVQLHGRRCRQIDQESLAVALRQLALTEEHLQRFLAAGRPQPPCRIDCDLRAIVDELVQLVMPACRHRKIELKIDCPADWNTRLWADADQLRQLLLNLMLNAIDAAGPGGQVRVVLETEAEQATARIYDSGPGPPPQVAERLFEPFATGKPEGVGLGLTVARQIAEAHGGQLRFESDGGTCFRLTLPLAVPEAALDCGAAGARDVKLADGASHRVEPHGAAGPAPVSATHSAV